MDLPGSVRRRPTRVGLTSEQQRRRRRRHLGVEAYGQTQRTHPLAAGRLARGSSEWWGRPVCVYVCAVSTRKHEAQHCTGGGKEESDADEHDERRLSGAAAAIAP